MTHIMVIGPVPQNHLNGFAAVMKLEDPVFVKPSMPRDRSIKCAFVIRKRHAEYPHGLDFHFSIAVNAQEWDYDPFLAERTNDPQSRNQPLIITPATMTCIRTYRGVEKQRTVVTFGRDVHFQRTTVTGSNLAVPKGMDDVLTGTTETWERIYPLPVTDELRDFLNASGSRQEYRDSLVSAAQFEDATDHGERETRRFAELCDDLDAGPPPYTREQVVHTVVTPE